jgi:hypothetical protein
MNGYLRNIVSILILFVVISGSALIVNSAFSIGMNDRDIIILVLSFAVSSLLSLIVFTRGSTREPGAQTMHTFVSTGLKFILELFIILVWFVVAKKTSAEYILLFFVLYLAFSIYYIKVLLKTLRKKSL